MKKELISLIKMLGIGLTELIIDIDLDYVIINSIEYRSPDEVWLHHFKEELDFEIEFDEIEKEYQKKIFNTVKTFLYN